MKKLYTSKYAKLPPYEYFNHDIDFNSKHELLPEADIESLLLAGDVLIRLKNGGSITSQTLCRVSFNVSFLDQIFEVGVDRIDPNAFKKDNRFPPYFRFGVESIKYCENCQNYNDVNQLCMN